MEKGKTTFRTILNAMKPWILYIGIFLILRYTGIISAFSVVTQKALMHTGAMDAKPESEAAPRNFNYNFFLQDVNGKKIDIQTLKGKPLFINVWATWCGPCRAEMPSIQSLYNSIDHDKVVFIMLSLDQQDPYAKVDSFLKKTGYTFPVYFPSGQLPAQLQVSTIPTTFVIDSKGKIVFHEAGSANYNTEEFKKFMGNL
jgi:thiol-disulfide isomerase/thioredoxin